jgi:hypothetical protein
MARPGWGQPGKEQFGCHAKSHKTIIFIPYVCTCLRLCSRELPSKKCPQTQKKRAPAPGVAPLSQSEAGYFPNGKCFVCRSVLFSCNNKLGMTLKRACPVTQKWSRIGQKHLIASALWLHPEAPGDRAPVAQVSGRRRRSRLLANSRFALNDSPVPRVLQPVP